MDGDEVWARCAECQTELKQTDTKCPKCGCTKKDYARGGLVTLGIEIPKAEAKQKRRGYGRFIREMISRRKSSGDPTLKNVVHEQRTIDREKYEWHQVVKDAKTGEILHEEHEPLSQHKKNRPDGTP